MKSRLRRAHIISIRNQASATGQSSRLRSGTAPCQVRGGRPYRYCRDTQQLGTSVATLERQIRSTKLMRDRYRARTLAEAILERTSLTWIPL